ncbi:MAG TPA: hypothetical protein VNA26_01625, partial [Chitinophagaceae bacterium]|nr:hypothetical protein [Chitinophagaceae bacterium]
MKKYLLHSIAILVFASLLFTSCKKNDVVIYEKESKGHLKQTKTYPSDFLIAWLNFNLRVLRNNVPAINNFIANQHQAYGSIALYESVVNGMPAYQSLSGQLDAMPPLPKTQPGLAYHWPTCANTVLAKVTRLYYTTISADLAVSRESLENAFNSRFQTEVDATTFQRSVDYGNTIAQ